MTEEKRKPFTTMIKPSILKHLRIFAAERETSSIAAIIEEALIRFLESEAPEKRTRKKSP
jgi:hypothetical protein